jgi:serine/threonine protein kinase
MRPSSTDIQSAMALSHNTHLGHYTIDCLIGRGGMGEVYLARDESLRRAVALKLLLPDFTLDNSRVLRFEQEAYAASALNHPNIVTIYGVGLENGVRYMVTEFIDGESLRHRLSRGRLVLHEALDVAIQIASALTAAHQVGIIHRDIKPENTMLRNDGIVKVLDFGLAKLVEQESPDPEASTIPLVQTAEGARMATPMYMSPEQARGQVVDHRTDIWSLGVVLYEMVTGRSPFEGATSSDLVAEILKTEPAPLTAYSAEAPAELQRIVRKTLRKNCEERYQSIKDLALDLKSVKRELEFSAEFEYTKRISAEESPELKAGTLSSAVTAREGVPAKTESAGLAATGGSHNVSLFRRYQRTSIFLITIVILATLSLVYRYLLAGRSKNAAHNEPQQSATARNEIESGKSPAKRLYWDMTQDEQTRFIAEQAQGISAMLGPNPTRLNEESIAQIKVQVDHYVARKDSLSADVFHEGLRPIYSRASLYASFITEAFNERHVPPVIGLYIAMTETEYHPCDENQFGGQGLFGFTSRTAARYGAAPSERCDPRKISRAAARYLDDLTSEFGSDSASITLAILSYNMGETQVREYLHTLLNEGIRERSFWALSSHAEMFGENFRLGGNTYVTRFYAAAILGENPQAFDLQIQPLSTYSKVPAQPQ